MRDVEFGEHAVYAPYYTPDDKGVFHSDGFVTSVESMNSQTVEHMGWRYLVSTDTENYWVVAAVDVGFSDIHRQRQL